MRKRVIKIFRRTIRPRLGGIQVLFVAFCLFGSAVCLQAGGISSPNASMYLGNLRIGQTYSLQQLLGYPFSVTYRGRSMVGLRINLRIPDEKTSDGFEPLPDASWIEIARTEFSLDPGQTAETDILITIPNDEKYLGGRFIVRINPETTVPEGAGAGLAFGVALLCDLRLEIAPKPPTPEEIRQLRQQRFGHAVEVKVSPERIFINEVPIGRRVDVKREYGEVIRIINASDFPVEAALNSIPVEKFGMFPPEGYELPPDYNWLKPRRRRVRVPRNSITEIPLHIKIPKGAAHLGKKYYFVVSIEIASKIRNVRHITKVYVETEK